MGKPRKKRTAEEEAAIREARRAADRERCRLRRLDPVYMASERIKKRQRWKDPEYARRRREKDAEWKRNQRQLTGLTEYQRWKARLASGVPHPRLHRNQYTSCEKTVSKSTEANIAPKIDHVSTQTDGMQGFYNACPPAEVPQPIKECQPQQKQFPEREEPPLVAFLNRSAAEIQVLLQSNETQQSQVEGVTKQHPLYCRGPRIATPGPVKVVEGASAYAKEAADKTTWCTGIYQTNMYSPTVSCWMQSHDLEDSDNVS
ncbi:uncharacterized protein LOC119164514 isoform X2 [Rhipicephalus microplus]|uniref:uncharacterized protein LOC119164514 isoform X2 n=1 Tax=Rhipicephalus microplus TaxID=6941 RepID=UPI003F6BBE9A